jgi:hypothetical protein
MTFFQKAEHLWEYYRLPILGGVAAVAFVIYLLFQSFKKEPETWISVIFVGAKQQESSFAEAYIEESGGNPSEEEITKVWVGDIDFENGSAGYNEYQL